MDNISSLISAPSHRKMDILNNDPQNIDFNALFSSSFHMPIFLIFRRNIHEILKKVIQISHTKLMEYPK